MKRAMILATILALAAGVGAPLLSQQFTERESPAPASTVGAGVAVLPVVSDRPVKAEDFAAPREELGKAKTATWHTAFYHHFISKDGNKHRWVRMTTGNKGAFKAPGLYRREDMAEDGGVQFVSIQDAMNRALLNIHPAKQEATVRYLVEADYGPRGPFALVLGLMERNDLAPLGEQEKAGRKARGFRHSFWTAEHNQKWSYDFWLDAKTGKLLTFQVPGGDLFRPEDIVKPAKNPGRTPKTIEVEGTTYTKPPGLSSSGLIVHDIQLDVPLDDSLFSLKPPADYTLKTERPPAVTEKDVLEFMRVVAEYFGGKFPEHMPRFNYGTEYDRFEHIEHNVPKEKRTVAENRMVEAMHKWWSAGIPGPGPMHVFLHHQIVDGSWSYVGAGVKLGDKNRVVCWYRLKDSKTYRVVHGDLSVKDVPEKELPADR